MRLLLDTHVFIWAVMASPLLKGLPCLAPKFAPFKALPGRP